MILLYLPYYQFYIKNIKTSIRFFGFYQVQVDEIWNEYWEDWEPVYENREYGNLLQKECIISIISELRKTPYKHTLTIGATNIEKLSDVYV